jgi:cephalosporin-C deacetylase
MKPPSDPDRPADGELARPADFDTFWAETLRALDAVSSDIQCAAVDTRGSITHSRVEFNGLEQARIHGYLLHWDDTRPRPLVVYTHGYNSQYEVLHAWADAGFNVFGFDTRGFGRSVWPRHPDGWILSGVESPHTSIIRGAVCDYVRAIEVAQSLCGKTLSRTLAYGFSFAGAMALMAESVATHSDLVVAGVPSFGWMSGRRRLVRKGSGQEVNDFLRAHPSRAAAVMQTLAYFDTANFAAAIARPTLIGVGLRDIVVPAPTVLAISDRLRCPHRVMTFPHSHSDHEDEKLWLQFELAWQALLVAPDPAAAIMQSPAPAG